MFRVGERVRHTALDTWGTIVGPTPIEGWWEVRRDDGPTKLWHEQYMLNE